MKDNFSQDEKNFSNIKESENSSFVNLDDCWGLCLDLSVEYGYAEVRYGNCMLGSYTLGQ